MTSVSAPLCTATQALVVVSHRSIAYVVAPSVAGVERNVSATRTFAVPFATIGLPLQSISNTSGYGDVPAA